MSDGTHSAEPLLTRHAELRAAGSLLLAKGRELELRVEGNSMSPTIPEHARVRVRARESGTYRPGEVVAFVAGDRIISHRVIAVGRMGPARGHLLTQGDNRHLPELVPPEDVIGSIRSIHPPHPPRVKNARPAYFVPVPDAPRGARIRDRRSHVVCVTIGALLQLHPRLALFACERVHRRVRGR